MEIKPIPITDLLGEAEEIELKTVSVEDLIEEDSND